MTTIAAICERDVICAGAETTVQAAAALMRRHHVGCIVIVDESTAGRVPAGIVTDRDIVIEVSALDLDPKVITIGDICTPNLQVVREGDGLLDAADIMRGRGVRRLPVVNERGELTGIISIDDLFEALTAQLSGMAGILCGEREQEMQERR
jgi:CBS domain-containing protein